MDKLTSNNMQILSVDMNQKTFTAKLNSVDFIYLAAMFFSSFTKFFHITLKNVYRPKKTGKGSQHNHYHGHSAQIAHHYELAKSESDLAIKLYAAEKFGYETITLFKKFKMPKSESKASIEEVSMLIQAAHEIANDAGLKLIEEDSKC